MRPAPGEIRAVRQAARAVYGQRTTVHGLDVRLHDHPKKGTRDLQVEARRLSDFQRLVRQVIGCTSAADAA
jgi:hypothetical protein